VPPLIQIENATEHNLKHVDLGIPREQLVVMTGPSGSGKSSLAFDVIFAEGQRRYLETLSPYARQYMPQLPRPAVDRVLGIPPCVSLEQRITRGGVTSTVATVTEVAHHLRLLWARAGLLHCPDCRVPIAPRPARALIDEVLGAAPAGAEVKVLAPVVRGRKGSHREVFAKAVKEGVREARIDGAMRRIAADTKLERYKEHDVELVLGALDAGDPALEALLRSALEKGDGAAFVFIDGAARLLSTKRSCARCGRGFPELDPRFFSANTRQGQCEGCEGSGVVAGASGEETRCGACGGSRLSPLARAVTVDGLSIDAVLARTVTEAHATLAALTLPEREAIIAKVPLAEAARRLAFLERLGLGYLALDRAASTLSGGELQRVRLSAQLGAGLTGVLYVLDEPTIGLHPRDTGRLVEALRGLVDRGNSVLVVEHDTEVIRAADYVVDIGPGGGRHGGAVVAEGTPVEVAADPRSATGRALARPSPAPPRRPVEARPSTPPPRRKSRSKPTAAREVEAKWLTLEGARLHNLRGDRVEIPLGRLSAVTGVSGSGKSTLVRQVLLPLARRALGLTAETKPAGELLGYEGLKRAVEVDQSPIGRTPRSVPATYIGVWDTIRRLLAGTPLARARGYGAARFSFNVEGGRCPECKGQGAIVAEMAFLPDVLVPCDRCGGSRFGADTLDVRWHGRHAGELLELEVEEAVEVFEAVSKVREPLALMQALGLGYLKLGQPSNTLSGGEAQRVKLVAELAQGASAGPTLYVLDEPTTGLHREDVDRLIGLLQRLVDRGDTVVVIEHQTDVIRAADWVVDLGPEGGEGGGRVVVAGTPEQVAATKESRTGRVLGLERPHRARATARSR
jgi:excinuclease ABC subunit A